MVLYCQQGCSCYYHVQHMFRVHFFLSLCCLGLGFLSFDGFLGEKGEKKENNKKRGINWDPQATKSIAKRLQMKNIKHFSQALSGQRSTF